MRILFFQFCLLAFSAATFAQTTIHLANPSFEGETRPATLPEGWLDFGFENETPPDIQPGLFNCSVRPLHGNTYLGLVTRDNNTWERVGQQLESPLLKDSLYDFSLCLMASPFYFSTSRMTHGEVNYNGPVRLRIWGVNAAENIAELLAETPVVSGESWTRYNFSLTPVVKNLEIILLEACYGDAGRLTNGNLLIDNCSAFTLQSGGLATGRGDAQKEKSVSFPDVFGLYNASFEKAPGNGLPIGWEQRTDKLLTMPRTHPAEVLERLVIRQNGQKQYVKETHTPSRKTPRDGKRYLSLLASEDEQCQAVSQRLEGFLQKDTAYTFSIHLARSKHFKQIHSARNALVDFKNPLKLRIWGGRGDNLKAELLAESRSVFDTNWNKHEFRLQPARQNYNWITLEAAYVSENGRPYNGNLLLDACSSIVKSRH